MGPAPLSLYLARCVPASHVLPACLALLRGVVCCCVWYVVCLHCPVYARASCCRALPACAVAIIVRFPSDGRVDKDQQSRTLHERRRVHPIGGDTDRHGRVGKPNCDAAPPSRSAVWRVHMARATRQHDR